MISRIALVGQTDTAWKDDLIETFRNRHAVWVAYTYRITKNESFTLSDGRRGQAIGDELSEGISP
jgi:hypothetical protein